MKAFFTKSISVYRLASASSKESYALQGTILGYIAPMSAQEAFITDGNPAQQYKLFADYSADVKKTDRLTYDGISYLVTGIQKFDFGAMRRLEASLEQFNS
jgi:hypothetical protein